MSAELTSPAFWSDRTDYRNLAHDFTSHYSQRAWELADLPAGSRVLDIAAGAGALAVIAARGGARVLATDFAPGMVAAITERGLAGLEARVMDGQALDLPDASFDAAFSMFGIMLFADWRKGLAEMARILRPGGLACIGTWQEPAGAAANLLLAQVARQLFPDHPQHQPVAGMAEFTDPARFAAAMAEAGLGRFALHEVTSDFVVQPELLADPDRLFQFSPLWPELNEARKSRVLHDLAEAMQRGGGTIAVPSPAWLGFARRTG
jgi:ubiquinone/menaquinone biosynthesis C-methylase UbiE